MLERFGQLPLVVQVAALLGVAVLLVALGEFVSVPYLFPVKDVKDEILRLSQQKTTLDAEVAQLNRVRQRHQQFRQQLADMEVQLENSKVLVPTEKRTDDFMRLLQSSAVATRIAIRRLASRPVVYKDFYAEMPFAIQLDGPYYNLQEFYERLSQTTRIINVGGLQLESIDTAQGQFDYVPGTSVAGQCIITTYYIPSEAELEAAAPPGPGRRR